MSGFHFFLCVGGVQPGGFQGSGFPLCVADTALKPSLFLTFGVPGVILRLARDFAADLAQPRNKHIRRDVSAVDAIQPRRFPVACGADGDDLNAVAVQVLHIAAPVIAGDHFALPRVAQGAGGGFNRHPKKVVAVVLVPGEYCLRRHISAGGADVHVDVGLRLPVVAATVHKASQAVVCHALDCPPQCLLPGADARQHLARLCVQDILGGVSLGGRHGSLLILHHIRHDPAI